MTLPDEPEERRYIAGLSDEQLADVLAKACGFRGSMAEYIFNTVPCSKASASTTITSGGCRSSSPNTSTPPTLPNSILTFVFCSHPLEL